MAKRPRCHAWIFPGRPGAEVATCPPQWACTRLRCAALLAFMRPLPSVTRQEEPDENLPDDAGEALASIGRDLAPAGRGVDSRRGYGWLRGGADRRSSRRMGFLPVK